MGERAGKHHSHTKKELFDVDYLELMLLLSLLKEANNETIRGLGSSHDLVTTHIYFSARFWSPCGAPKIPRIGGESITMRTFILCIRVERRIEREGANSNSGVREKVGRYMREKHTRRCGSQGDVARS